MRFSDRLKHAWDAFQQREPPVYNYGPSAYGSKPPHSSYKDSSITGTKRSMLTSIFNRIAIDVSMVRMEHVKRNEDGGYCATVKDGLNTILTLEANLDQTGMQFMQDVVMSMFDEGAVAVVPTFATLNPNFTQGYEILSARVAKIKAWYPEYVKVEVFDENTLMKRELVYKKSTVAILENPFYSIMNEPNSTLQRLLRTLDNIDVFDKRQASGKLDLIIQFPYSIRTELRRKEADKRIEELENQLRNRELGIGYIDGSEKVIQLGRSLENNLWKQAQDLTDQLFNQIGMPKSIFEGTATDEEKVTYYNNTVSPILANIAQEFARKFLSKTARTQGHSIDYFQNVFKLIPVTKVSEIVDKFTRNEILSPNEVRMELGYKPSDDPESNKLRNRNLNKSSEGNDMMLPGMEELLSEDESTSDQDASNGTKETQTEVTDDMLLPGMKEFI